MSSEINKKIDQIAIDHFGGSNVKFAYEMGVNEANIRGYRKTIIPKIDFLVTLSDKIGITLDSLVRHDKFIEKHHEDNIVNENIEVYKLETDRDITHQQIPLFDIEAVAGVLPILSDINGNQPIDYLQVPNAPKCDGAIYATGDSMYPILKSGDIMAYKVIEDFINDVYWGQMYILHIEVAGDLFRTVKYIHKGKSDLYFRLVSQNKHHQDKEVLISKIKSIAQVKLTVRTL